MKEIIEYILSTIIVLSLIPIYNYVMDTLYTPPVLEVSRSVAYSIAEFIVGELNKACYYGNLTSPIYNPAEAIRIELQYFISKYCSPGRLDCLHVKLRSIGLRNVKLDGSSVIVETSISGNVSLLLVYNDGLIINTSAVFDKFENGVYVYKLNIQNPSKLLFVAAVIDNGLYRYINYYVADNTRVINLGNMNNQLHLFTKTTVKCLNTSKGCSIYIAPYVDKFEVFNDTVTYRVITSIDRIRVIPGTRWRILNVSTEKHEIRYYAVNSGYTVVNGVNYSHLNVFLGETVTEEIVSYYVYWHGRTRRIENYTIIEKGEEELIGVKPIKLPVYNLFVVILKSPDGVYVAFWYPYELTIGWNVPTGLPVTKVSLIKRIGMVDYLIEIYVWRYR